MHSSRVSQEHVLPFLSFQETEQGCAVRATSFTLSDQGVLQKALSGGAGSLLASSPAHVTHTKPGAGVSLSL